MSAGNFVKASFFGRDDVVAAVIGQALDPAADDPGLPARSQLLEGPARRGKSWVLEGVYDQLSSQPPLQAQPPPPNGPQPTYPAVACMFKSQQIPLGDYHAGVAAVWDALLPRVPTLARPPAFLPSDPQPQRLQQLRAYLQQQNPVWTRLVEVAVEALEQTSPGLYLVILVDGLDEIDPLKLDAFEFEFLERLFSCPRVRLVATRRSEVITHGWRRTLVKRHTRIKPLTVLPPQAAEQQVDDLFQRAASRLRFDDLTRLFRAYRWQNPGANAIFVRQALEQERRGQAPQIGRAEIDACLLELIQPDNPGDPSLAIDLKRLREVAAQHPTIDVQAIPRRLFNLPLGAVGDRERDLWLGRLQRRGIILVADKDRFQVHEEFVALCRE